MGIVILRVGVWVPCETGCLGYGLCTGKDSIRNCFLFCFCLKKNEVSYYRIERNWRLYLSTKGGG